MLKSQKIQIPVIAILLCLAYGLWLAPLKPVQIANLKILDAFFSLISGFDSAHKVNRDIALIAVDDESIRQINLQWPWPRSLIAYIIKKISANNPALICADFVFAGKSLKAEEDSALIDAVRKSGNIYAAAYFGADGRYVAPDEDIALALKDFGFVNKPRDIDNTVRRMRPYFLSDSGDVIDYSLSLKAASSMLNVPAANLGLGVPMSKDGTAYIKFFGSLDKFNSIPVWKILNDSADTSTLGKKAVFFGVTSESFHDTYHTPLGIMPGVLIDINEFLTYVNKSYFRYASHETNAVILFVFVLIAVFGGLRLPILSGIALTTCEIGSFLFLGLFLFTRHIIIDLFGPVLLILTLTILLHGTRYLILVVENIVLRKEATTDGLTELYLYRYFELQLRRELKKAFYTKKNLALVIYDIDYFKRINDAHGHEFGNVILKSIARSLKNHSRKNNIIARYGGEEFCIIVPGMKRPDAIKYAERLRNLVSLLEFKTDRNDIVRVTMSAGIVTIEDAVSANATDFIRAADLALYRSKNSGRDRISVFDKILDKTV